MCPLIDMIDHLTSYFAAVSGTSMYDSWVYSVYNFALGLPIIFYGIFDQDIPADFALRHPEVCYRNLPGFISC